MANPTPTPAPIRSISKGSGAFVNEIFTNADGSIARVNSYTSAQLTAMAEQINTQIAALQASQLTRITSMQALLT